MAPTLEQSTTCRACGTPRDINSVAGLGCMLCMLQLGFRSRPERNPELPSTLGNYRLEKHQDGSMWELGRGAMGVTYRATDTSLQRPVALKIVKAEFAARGAEARERFAREARAAAAVRQPNVATA